MLVRRNLSDLAVVEKDRGMDWAVDFSRYNQRFGFGWIEGYQPLISPELNFCKISVKMISRINRVVDDDI
ncbi:hypothetical protein DPMN_094336 [Dreissena polymorpha]|uniref:Uncharacterized protein n=1 Tax=Dreissena polymorpha TaxID=45954 RepID=A0A9D4R1V6_DREPO|nr:hypothetical protein DPMN_094336 [Dreissena polymorpha]